MDSFEGHFLIAMPNMGDVRFEKAVVFVCSHSDDGAMGLVVNRTLEKPSTAEFLVQLGIVADGERGLLPDDVSAPALCMGGPVEPGRGFVLHSADFTSDTTISITDEISLTATLEILRAISKGRGPSRRMIALGYAGWAAGQLEEEIVSNGWLTSRADSELVFDQVHETKYERALLRMGVNPSLLSADAGHA
ncbi:MAG: YqgE/AlgH family protein [Rhizobiaceae bacterium]